MARHYKSASYIKAVARTAAQSSRQAEARRKEQLRQLERQHQAAERQKKQAEMERRRQQAQSERERKQIEKEQKQQYLQDRLDEVDQLNADLSTQISELDTVLEHTLDVNDTIAFDSLRIKDEYAPFNPPEELTKSVPTPNKKDFLGAVKPKSLLENALGLKNRYDREIQAAEALYTTALKTWETTETEKKAKLEQLRAEYVTAKSAYGAKAKQRDQEVSELEAEYKQGEAPAVITYTTMVLERSEYPNGFPQQFRVAYAPDSKEMVVEYELPSIEVIPKVAEYKYNKTKDTVDEKARKVIEEKDQYQNLVAGIALRTIHEILEADQGNHIQVVTFSGLVSSVDPATGNDVHPCVISVRTTKESFSGLNLRRIDKLVCLRNLGAQVSARPDERLPVKPVVEFNMIDKRFVEQGDVLSGLDARPNLMELSPSEFEALVSNLFGKMGLETKLTRASKDGGVDAVAFDTRPVLGGKVVIQAKRYRNTVGVSAVRDLYGTMLNEGASKGIIVATSSYGPDTYEFAKDKPLELIDGGGLLYLLDQVGIKAKIIMPQE